MKLPAIPFEYTSVKALFELNDIYNPPELASCIDRSVKLLSLLLSIQISWELSMPYTSVIVLLFPENMFIKKIPLKKL